MTKETTTGAGGAALQAAALLALAAASAGAQAAFEDFKVNGRLVTAAEQQAVADSAVARGAPRGEALERAVKDELVRQAVIAQQARKAKLDQTRDVKAAVEAYADKLLVAAWRKDRAEKSAPAKAELEERIAREKAAWGDKEVHVRHILVATEQEAWAALRQVLAGGDFAQIARERSIDNARNKAEGGLIEWTSPAYFDAQFAGSFYHLQPGDTARVPVHTTMGWHVVRLEGTRPAMRFADPAATAARIRQDMIAERLSAQEAELMAAAKVEPAGEARKAPAEKKAGGARKKAP
ncbi:MAG: peptidylprolyl isomerase [Duodenibacillus sp.]|nr:peptidylprolyl isomerase [Duodenibacillus sp.]